MHHQNQEIKNSKEKSKLSNFYTRTFTTIIIFPPILYAVSSGGFLYFMLLFLVVLLAGYEWSDICGKCSFGTDSMAVITTIMLAMTSFFMMNVILGLAILLFGTYIVYIIAKIRMKIYNITLTPSYINRPKWLAIGTFYLGLGFSALAYVSKVDFYGYTLIWLFLATVSSDVFAYIFGSIIGGKKIAPSISPGKSWSGFFGAMIVTAGLGYLFSIFLATNNSIFMMIIGALMVLFAHMGDMIESAFKRYVKVKDTSNIIPGHGGVLDRIDAALMTAIFIATVSIVLNKSPLFFSI